MQPTEVSVGVVLEKWLIRFKLFNKDTCFAILFSLTIFIPKYLHCNSKDAESHQNDY